MLYCGTHLLALTIFILANIYVDCSPLYETVCEELESSHRCEDMSSDLKKWLGRETVDNGTCLQDCLNFAKENNYKGCCFQNSHAVNRNCRFFMDQGIEAFPSGKGKASSASICYQKLITDSPSYYPSLEPTLEPTSDPTCSSSTAPKNWQQWAKLDYEVTTACGPDDDHACYGNGDCICDKCVCDVGWRGPYCSQLDLLPANKDKQGISMDGRHPTWGGSAMFENGKWNLLAGSKIALDSAGDINPYTYWDRSPVYDIIAANDGQDPYGGEHPWEFTVDADKDPFPSGGTSIETSRDLYEERAYLSLYESEGADASGPYHEKTSKWFKAFRADLKKDPLSNALLELSNANGGFTILQSVSGSIAGPWLDKDDNPIDAAWAGATPDVEPLSNTPMPPPVYKFVENGHCAKGWNSLGDLAGKYITKEDGQFRECTIDEKDKWNCHLADPALLLHPNGTSVIAYRGTRCESANGHKDHTERIGLLIANHWKGPYVAQDEPILEDDEVMNGGLEDLFMWQDHRGTHMIVHSQAQDHAYDLSLDRATFHHKKKRGAYLFSADGKDRWSLSDWELFPSEIRWDDGTTQFLLKQQRPSLIFDPSTGRPSHLITGVDFLFDPCCDWYAYGSAWTLVQPISSCPAGTILQNGSCASCLLDGYGGKCLEATSKYGSCVCAVCANGYSGDECENEPEPVYETTCEELQPLNECQDMGGEAKWLGRETVDDGTCLQDCFDYAMENNIDGCCYQYVHPTHRNCRFFEAQARTDADSTDKHASICSRQIVNVDNEIPEATSDPTKTPTGVSSPPSPSCTICDDEPTKGMKKKGKSCTDMKLEKHCNKNAAWISKGICKLSCYNEGFGYEGNVCCTDTS